MSSNHHFPSKLLVAGLTLLLGACGGGGGGNSFLPLSSFGQPPSTTQEQASPAAKFSIGGAVQGLTGTLELQNNAGDDLQVTADGKFAFAKPINAGDSYEVKIRTQPLWQFCTVTNGAGSAKGDVVDVGVACSAAIGDVTTFAGTGAVGATDGPSNTATFAVPAGVVIDSDGGLLVTDAGTSLIRRVSPAGDVLTIAGNATQATVDGNGTGASFDQLIGITKTSSGDTFVVQCATNNHLVRRMTAGGDVSTFAGSGNLGEVDNNGAAAEFACPVGITSDAVGNLYVADNSGSTVRKISPSGDVLTLAGTGAAGSVDANGTAASFDHPLGVAVDKAGNVFVADTNNHKIRKISSSREVTTFAGTGQVGNADGGPGMATFDIPTAIAVDQEGNLFVTDSTVGGGALLRRITAAGVVTTVAGRVTAGPVAQDGVGAAATFGTQAFGLAISSDGSVYVADTLNNKIRKVTPVAAPS